MSNWTPSFGSNSNVQRGSGKVIADLNPLAMSNRLVGFFNPDLDWSPGVCQYWGVGLLTVALPMLGPDVRATLSAMQLFQALHFLYAPEFLLGQPYEDLSIELVFIHPTSSPNQWVTVAPVFLIKS